MSRRKMTGDSLADLLFAQRLEGRETAHQSGHTHDPLIPIVLALARLDAQEFARRLMDGEREPVSGKAVAP